MHQALVQKISELTIAAATTENHTILVHSVSRPGPPTPSGSEAASIPFVPSIFSPWLATNGGVTNGGAVFRRVRRAPWKSKRRRKKAFFLRYPQILGACAMTTRFLDKQMCTFRILLSWRFPRKEQHFGTISSLTPPSCLPPKTQILFLSSSRRL